MSDKSPLFISSLELLSHSIEIYTEGKSKKFKFIILHLANAIELILKDRLIDKGISIYCKGGNQTINIWKAFEDLEQQGITIKERPIIEILIDDRNTIQHRFGFPNGDSVYYYIESVIGFFKRFLNEQYNVNLIEALESHLSRENLKFIGLISNESGDVVEKAVLQKLMKISPKSAVLEVYNLIEKEIIDIFKSIDFGKERIGILAAPSLMIERLFSRMVQDEYIQENTSLGFSTLKNVRNQVAHSSINDEVQNLNAEELIEVGLSILTALRKAKNDSYFSNDLLKQISKA